MRNAIRIVGMLALGFVVVLALPVATAVSEIRKEPIEMQNYGVRVRFAPGTLLSFPDLELRYLGSRSVETKPTYPQGFIYHDFEASVGKETVPLSWSSGTSDIAPVTFTLTGRQFVLELGHSILSATMLHNDELVLWPEKLFQAETNMIQLLSTWRRFEYASAADSVLGAILSVERGNGVAREFHFKVPDGEVVVSVSTFNEPLAASEHFDRITHAHTPAGTNLRLPIPDSVMWANRADANSPVMLWLNNIIYEISGALMLKRRVRLARWLVHEMNSNRAEEVPDDTTLWLLLKLTALPDLRQLSDAEAGKIKARSKPYRHSNPIPADLACNLHDGTARGWHMVAGGTWIVVNPITKTELQLDNLDLHRIERHGQRFSVEQVQFLDQLP